MKYLIIFLISFVVAPIGYYIGKKFADLIDKRRKK